MIHKEFPLDALLQDEAALGRRRFIKTAGTGIIAATALAELARSSDASAQTGGHSAAPKTGSPAAAAAASKVTLPSLDANSEQQKEPLPAPAPKDERVGFAIVGLGHLSLEAIMPAFSHSKYAKPVALVSGDAEKAKKVARQYGIKESAIYNYSNYESMASNKDIEAVYIVLPNSMHAEYTIRAAKAGKHVLCEKPMAVSVAEAERMTEACKRAGVKLMVAYRIQYEPNNRYMQELLRSRKWGATKLMNMVNTQNIGTPDQFRLKRALAGGGSLPDIGLYCLNTARFLSGEEPERVTAIMHSTPGDTRFKEVEETVMFQLHFPSGLIANCTTSYGVHQARHYRCYADDGGWFGMDPAFPYKGLRGEISHAKGDQEMKMMPQISEKDQFALELDHMALCIREDHRPYTPGEEGLQDMRIMEAIYRAAKEGKAVELKKMTGVDTFRGWKGGEG